MRGRRIARNAAALLASQPITWALTLFFTILVPRNIGPAEWGEWTIAASIGGVVTMILDLGANTVLLKGMSRYPEDSDRALGVLLVLRLALAPVLVLAMVAFSSLAGYSAHTRLIVALCALPVAVTSISLVPITALQALERMQYPALAGVLTGLILTGGAFVIVKLLGLGVVSIALLSLVAQLVGLVVLLAALRRARPIRLALDLQLVAQYVREGLPYWATGSFFLVYAALDGVLLSLLGATYENGWYGVATRMVATPGFVLVAVTSAVFPAMSRGLARGGDGSAGVVGRSFRLLVTLSLPMAAGLALVSGNLVTLLYGGWFAPAGPALAVLALTIPPVFVATIASQCLIAADRQVRWAVVMGALCGANLVLNLVVIPYFHAHYRNAALGAALSLLVTDVASGVLGLVLLPANLRAAVRSAVAPILRSLLATLAMAAAVYPLRERFLPVPVLVGGVVFVAAALVLRVFPADELAAVAAGARRLARAVRPHRRVPPGILVPAPVREPRAGTPQPDPDVEVA